MEANYFDSNTILVTGKTYPHKFKLKQLGGKWDKTLTGWKIPKSNEQAIVDLIGQPIGSNTASSSTASSNTTSSSTASSSTASSNADISSVDVETEKLVRNIRPVLWSSDLSDDRAELKWLKWINSTLNLPSDLSTELVGTVTENGQTLDYYRIKGYILDTICGSNRDVTRSGLHNLTTTDMHSIHDLYDKLPDEYKSRPMPKGKINLLSEFKVDIYDISNKRNMMERKRHEAKQKRKYKIISRRAACNDVVLYNMLPDLIANYHSLNHWPIHISIDIDSNILLDPWTNKYSDDTCGSRKSSSSVGLRQLDNDQMKQLISLYNRIAGTHTVGAAGGKRLHGQNDPNGRKITRYNKYLYNISITSNRDGLCTKIKRNEIVPKLGLLMPTSFSRTWEFPWALPLNPVMIVNLNAVQNNWPPYLGVKTQPLAEYVVHNLRINLDQLVYAFYVEHSGQLQFIYNRFDLRLPSKGYLLGVSDTIVPMNGIVDKYIDKSGMTRFNTSHQDTELTWKFRRYLEMAQSPHNISRVYQQKLLIDEIDASLFKWRYNHTMDENDAEGDLLAANNDYHSPLFYALLTGNSSYIWHHMEIDDKYSFPMLSVTSRLNGFNILHDLIFYRLDEHIHEILTKLNKNKQFTHIYNLLRQANHFGSTPLDWLVKIIRQTKTEKLKTITQWQNWLELEALGDKDMTDKVLRIDIYSFSLESVDRIYDKYGKIGMEVDQ